MLENRRLPIESGFTRYIWIYYKNRTNYICREDIGDEYYYLFKCPHFKTNKEIPTKTPFKTSKHGNL